jgi:hypothetical protein
VRNKRILGSAGCGITGFTSKNIFCFPIIACLSTLTLEVSVIIRREKKTGDRQNHIGKT